MLRRNGPNGRQLLLQKHVVRCIHRSHRSTLFCTAHPYTKPSKILWFIMFFNCSDTSKKCRFPWGHLHPMCCMFPGLALFSIPNYISIGSAVFGRPFIKRLALCYRTVVCPVCLSVLSVSLSVTLGCCGQTIRWIKMPLGTEVGLAQATLC